MHHLLLILFGVVSCVSSRASKQKSLSIGTSDYLVIAKHLRVID